MDERVELKPIAFSDLDGWMSDRHDEAFTAFQHTCRGQAADGETPRPAGSLPGGFEAACEEALSASGGLSRRSARQFFETHFCPHEVDEAGPGLLTSYYEPELEASRVKTDEFTAPLYALPDDLVTGDDVDGSAERPDLEAFRRSDDGSLLQYFTRADINAGALDGRGLELVWLRDPVDAFFVHIQGSTRVRFPDGSTARIGFAGKNGFGYTSVGRELLREGQIAPTAADSESIKSWMRANPKLALRYKERNESFVFFRELTGLQDNLGPVGGEGVQLTAQRSLAVDRSLYAYGLPFWIETELPKRGREGGRFHNLMIAQDTGAAIKGAARGDIFWGSGSSAGAFAGLVQVPGRFVVFLPCAR
ncbi:MAG: MltA domain-containing protein [Pseudomonadota bacterium]